MPSICRWILRSPLPSAAGSLAWRWRIAFGLAVLLVVILFAWWSVWSPGFEPQPQGAARLSSPRSIASLDTTPIANEGNALALPSGQRRLIAQLPMTALEQVSDGADGFHIYLGLGAWDQEEKQRFWAEQPAEMDPSLVPAVVSQRLLALAEIQRWLALTKDHLSLREGSLQIRADVPDAAVYELIILQHDINQSPRYPDWLWRQRLVAPRDHQTDVRFTALLKQALAYLEVVATDELDASLQLRLQVDSGDASWAWLRQRLAGEALDTEPWWQALPLAQLRTTRWGPLAVKQRLTWSLQSRGIADEELATWAESNEQDRPEMRGEQLLQAGLNQLRLDLNGWNNLLDSRVDLVVTLRDQEQAQGLAGFSIYRLNDHHSLCMHSDAEGRCLLSAIATHRPSAFIVEAPMAFQERGDEDELPRYPTQFTTLFEPLEYQETLEQGERHIALDWQVPIYRWLHLPSTDEPRSVGADQPRGEGFPVYFLQHEQIQNGVSQWQRYSAEHFIHRADGLWISTLEAGRYRLVAAIDTLEFQTSAEVNLAISQHQAQLRFNQNDLGRYQLAAALEALPGNNADQTYAIYCEDFPLAPIVMSRSEIIRNGIESSGCERVVWEWEDGSGESASWILTLP